jgi:hypothetical protein
MAIANTGAISFDTIQTEFGGTNPIAINEYYAGGSFVAAGVQGVAGAIPSSGQISLNQFQGSAKPVIGQEAFSFAGTYTWVAPAGVTSVSVVAIGGGGRPKRYCFGCVMKAGGGGGLGYKNNYTVTPGSSYTVVVGDGGADCTFDGGNSYFVSACVVSGQGARRGNENSNFQGRYGGSYTGDGGGAGGDGGFGGIGGGGGGAGGYSGRGGAGASSNQIFNFTQAAGAGGSGGGGVNGGGGGGVGLLGQGTSGAAFTNYCFSTPTQGGGGGSGGTAGGTVNNFCGLIFAGAGGFRGGGNGVYNCRFGGGGSRGGVRIIWPGTTRTFPSTSTGDL